MAAMSGRGLENWYAMPSDAMGWTHTSITSTNFKRTFLRSAILKNISSYEASRKARMMNSLWPSRSFHLSWRMCTKMVAVIHISLNSFVIR